MAKSAGAGRVDSQRLTLSNQQWQSVNGQLGLSARELQLVQHIFEGKKLSTIAQELKLSLGTVKTYNQRLHKKLGLSDQRELILQVAGVYEQLRQTEG
jgi:DNA-binding NarL/FixJ family response regulator